MRPIEIQSLKGQVKQHIKEKNQPNTKWGAIPQTSNEVTKRRTLHMKMTTNKQKRKRKTILKQQTLKILK